MLFWRPSGDFREMRGSSTFQNWSGSKFKEIQVSKFEIGIRHTFPIWDPWNGSKRARGKIINSRCRRFYLPGINIASEAWKAVLKIVKYQLNHFRGEFRSWYGVNNSKSGWKEVTGPGKSPDYFAAIIRLSIMRHKREKESIDKKAPKRADFLSDFRSQKWGELMKTTLSIRRANFHAFFIQFWPGHSDESPDYILTKWR